MNSSQDQDETGTKTVWERFRRPRAVGGWAAAPASLLAFQAPGSVLRPATPDNMFSELGDRKELRIFGVPFFPGRFV